MRACVSLITAVAFTNLCSKLEGSPILSSSDKTRTNSRTTAGYLQRKLLEVSCHHCGAKFGVVRQTYFTPLLGLDMYR